MSSEEAPEPLRVRPWHLLAGIGAGVLAAFVLRACTHRHAPPLSGVSEAPPAPGVSGAPPVSGVSGATPAPVDGGMAPPATVSAPGARTLPEREVTVFRLTPDGRGLRPDSGQVFATASKDDQVKQVVGLVLRPGPDGTPSAWPAGTTLQQAFLDLRRGTAYVSLSKQAAGSTSEGSLGEQLAVYSLVNSVVRSEPDLTRVQILIEGQEVPTLTGHLDLSAPLPFNASIVVLAPVHP